MLDLQTHFGDADAAKAGPLIPAGILKPHLVEWLDRSIVSGQVPSGAVIFRGRLEDFPFPGHEGRLEVLFDVRDGVLDYLPGWPRLSGAAGQVRFLDRQHGDHPDRRPDPRQPGHRRHVPSSTTSSSPAP